MEYGKIIGRERELFSDDVGLLEGQLSEVITNASFLVIGGAGSIGKAVTKEIFKRNPKTLDVVDISENNLVELVRDLRSSLGYTSGEFRTFAIDSGGPEFEALIADNGGYDYVLNLSALKHVRSEKDPYTLMRLVKVNIFNTIKNMQQASQFGCKKYFCVSTDKAANPVNMMGASKKIMEMFLMHHSVSAPISMARFANVAFSDGSLLHGFNQRLAMYQPLSAPNDVKRYFLTPQESGELCLLSCLFGENRDIFFPKLEEELHLERFSDIAVRFLESRGYEAVECASEQEAREGVKDLAREGKWPCYFFESDTSGEKSFEEFYTDREALSLERFKGIGVISNEVFTDPEVLKHFEEEIIRLQGNLHWVKEDLVKAFKEILPNFGHLETGKYLDGRM